MTDVMDLLVRAHRATTRLKNAAVQNDPEQIASACKAAEEFIDELVDPEIVTEMKA